MITNIFPRFTRNGRARGQSLVEFTIVLPILLLIVAGTLEVGNVLTHYNRVQLAAREAARFGAAGGSDLVAIVEDTAQEALEFEDENITIWEIRPQIETNGSEDPTLWTWADVDGSGSPWGVSPVCLKGDDCGLLPNIVTPEQVIADIGEADTVRSETEIDGVTFVIAVVRYETETVLNLPFFTAPGQESTGRIPVWAYEALAQEIDRDTIAQLQGGCSAYPLILNGHEFPENVMEGDVIHLPIDYEQNATKWHLGGFGITSWNIDHINPADVTNSCLGGVPGSICTSSVSLMDEYGFEEFQPPEDPVPDDALHRGDWVLQLPGGIANIQEDLTAYMDSGQYLRVMVYYLDPEDLSLSGGIVHDDVNNPKYVHAGSPYNTDLWQYQVADFAIVKIHEVFWAGQAEDTYVEYEFVRWDSSCGYDS